MSQLLEGVDLQTRILELGDWFQNMNLGGVYTAPHHTLGDYPTCKWQKFCDAIPSDLEGRSVLEIGCNAGFYAFEMKRRGAGRTLGIDSDARYLEQASFAAKVLGADVEFRLLDVYDLASLHERFDIVLCMGLLYHLRHPLLALDLIHEYAAGDMLVFQSMIRGSRETVDLERNYTFFDEHPFDDPRYPKMHFVEHSYADDPTNWWIPNKTCVEAMLRSSGFRVVSNPETEVYICTRQRREYEPFIVPVPGALHASSTGENSEPSSPQLELPLERTQ